MRNRRCLCTIFCRFGIASLLFVLGSLGLNGAAQAPRGQAPANTARSAQSMAPIDVTGYWVTAITEDWRLRMITPPKGDYQNVPLNPAGVQLLKAWNPEADKASGNQCKPYGAAAIMRMPTRIHITWQDDNTLKLDFDHGQQTRLVYFDQTKRPTERSWQGHAIGEWIDMNGRNMAQVRGRGAPPAVQGGLKVVTSNLKAQYIRKNGAPISENAVVTDMIERVPGPGGAEWLIVKTIVQDPTYFTVDLVTSAQFKREPDGSKWNPTPCEVELPPTPRPLREPPPRD
jgi:hypothetical protein